MKPTTEAIQATSRDIENDGKHDPVRDFDFLFGYWQVAHRKLRSRLTGCADWEEFQSTQQCWPLIGGICNTDESLRLDVGSDPAHIGTTFRCFDLTQQRWSIYWVSPRDGVLGLPPVVGSFSDGVGIFEADEMIGGQQVRVRFTWTVHSPTAAHWQQGFSLDQGATWEVNWTMAFNRITADEYARLNAARG